MNNRCMLFDVIGGQADYASTVTDKPKARPLGRNRLAGIGARLRAGTMLGLSGRPAAYLVASRHRIAPMDAAARPGSPGAGGGASVNSAMTMPVAEQ